MSPKIWDFWADKYDRLWVQRYSLKPTREYVLEELGEVSKGRDSLLDLGCGPGELLHEVNRNYPRLKLTGMDYSPKMLEISRQRNQKANHVQIDVSDLATVTEVFDVIVCTHSLPYYRDPKAVFEALNRMLTAQGRLIVGFASGNSFYDKVALSVVKLTTGKANYPSDAEFLELIRDHFYVRKLEVIRKASFMPRIAVYTLAKKTDGRERC
jgi:ubiquinone/menaquinone biosynthesis C-methylase UbiE